MFFMKNLLTSLSLLIVLNSNATTLVAVRHLPLNVVSSFERLHGHKQGNGYALQCKFANNSVVDHYELENTYEDPFNINFNRYTFSVVNHRNRIIKYVNYTVLPSVISYIIKVVFAHGTPSRGVRSNYCYNLVTLMRY